MEENTKSVTPSLLTHKIIYDSIWSDRYEDYISKSNGGRKLHLLISQIKDISDDIKKNLKNKHNEGYILK